MVTPAKAQDCDNCPLEWESSEFTTIGERITVDGALNVLQAYSEVAISEDDLCPDCKYVDNEIGGMIAEAIQVGRTREEAIEIAKTTLRKNKYRI